MVPVEDQLVKRACDIGLLTDHRLSDALLRDY